MGTAPPPNGTDILSPAQAQAMAFDTLQRDAHNAESLLLLARLSRQEGRADRARQWFLLACAADPKRAEIFAEFGDFLHGQNRTAEAIPVLRRALTLDPQNRRSQNRLALSCQVEGFYAEAERLWAALMSTSSDDVEARLNRGMLRRITGRYREAVQDLEVACAQLPPDHPQAGRARAALGMSLLCLGEWQRGWAAYEARLTYPGAAQTCICNYEHRVPVWDGGPVDKRTLGILVEQGLGDVIQFCRYLLPLRQTGAYVYFACYPPLIPLVEQSFPGLKVVSNEVLLDVDVYAPLLSLPHLLQPSLGEVPYYPGPYLRAGEDRVAFFRQHIATVAPQQRRIGVAWAGNPGYVGDKARSVPPQLMAALLDAVDADFFIIQPDANLAPFQELSITNLHDLSAELRSFADTAALLEALDGVLSVDTSVIHLAGGLGRPGWLLLPTDNDWRWGTGPTTPWYPSLKIFRQKTRGDWSAPLLDAARDIIGGLHQNGF